MKVQCYIHSLNSFVPEQVITNHDLSKIVDTNNQWIIERTGIEKRRKIADCHNVADMGFFSSQKSLEHSSFSECDLTHIIGATCTPEYLSPSVACIIAGKLNTANVMAFDINAACTGFIYGISICRYITGTDKNSNILLVCAEALTRRLNWKDRSTCVLFGDAAASCIISANSENALCSVIDVHCQSDGTQKELITVGGGTDCRYSIDDSVNTSFFLSMQGRDTYKHAVRRMVNICEEILAKNGLNINDIDIFIPHQANMRIIEAVGERLNINSEKVFTNLEEYGNTSAASIPLAIHDALMNGKIKKGYKMLITAFGAGLTWGAAILEF